MKKMRDTNTVLMENVHKMLVESGVCDDALAILDYYLPERHTVYELSSCGFDFVGEVAFGGSEGIYLDCYIVGCFNKSLSTRKIHCGTYKTLLTDVDSMMLMGKLSGALTFFSREYVNENLWDRYEL